MSVIWQTISGETLVKGFGEININNCNLFLGLHRDTPIIKTLKWISECAK